MKSARLFVSIIFLLSLFALTVTAKTENAARSLTLKLMLGETQVNVNVYEKEGSKITFYAPHHNEQLALRLAKEYVDKNGGRIVEVQSFDEKGLPSRYLKFVSDGKSYNIDPNRIFTDNGRLCSFTTIEVDLTVKNFADNILKLLFANGGKTLREGERMLVAVHNNSNVDTKAESAKSSDLTATAFYKGDNANRFSHGVFSDQAEGVFLSNSEFDADNFTFLSTYTFMRYFAEKGFNVIVQKSAPKLQTKICTIDDGSLSVYAGQQNIPYICLEADGENGEYRQRQMFEAVYQLVKSISETAPKENPAKP